MRPDQADVDRHVAERLAQQHGEEQVQQHGQHHGEEQVWHHGQRAG